MSTEPLYLEKELSWLSFNERVLQEAADKSVPLIERVRFLGIFSSNTDEFYKVRFADVKRRILINQERGSNENSKELLSKIQSRVLKLNQDFDTLYNEILLEMARRHIFLVNEQQLDDHQQNWLRKHFRTQILPHISPILLTDDVDLLQFLKDEYSYLAVEMQQGDSKRYALLEIPTDQQPRFIKLPEAKGKRRKTLILLDNIIRFCLDEIFSGLFEYDSLAAYAMKMTRDAEYDLSQEVEHSLMEQMSEGLSQRLTAMPVRFVYQRDMPADMVDTLCSMLKVSSYDSIIPGGRYHNFKDFIGFPNVGRNYLENNPLPPLESYQFVSARNAFDAIKAQDILLYYPYHTFNHMTELVRQAAYDPKVRSIKINIYRVAKQSRIIESMIDAANNGKRVTVVVELQARFDEEANIEWARRLTEAGVHVVFGVPGLKIHSKLCLITRIEGDELVRYAHIGTGNFHENTARIYTDFSLMTCKPAITDEVRMVFSYIQNPYQPVKFRKLIVSPRNSRLRMYDLIDREIAHAKQNLPAGITLKVNNLVDKGLINLLYQASNAGVKIKLIIRGMCSLIPGIKGISENITAISIVDRFLEHPRVMVFDNNGDPEVFISSADWMTRNIDNRIEVGCPIDDPALKQKIIDILNIQLSDTVKARVLDRDMSNNYVSRGNKRKIRSQIEIYDYLKQSEKQLKKQAQKSENDA
ncbi:MULTISPECIES: polyphosphate kinase 1 [Photobacterium]|uniref:Polyphosphate kinase n=1 Tax=Photobacterium ganghwense TaxID=320778 RepID=A0A0J1H7N8_9GAMM|nr:MULTISPECIES: polyphosphate kinase 1 [Photobacterium]KLV07701.1 polyphosphate kinase [Photobacterium ganghwense]MBV1842872.1 polyphosphate kinase 1 [Photobacterium ganghwense]PSU11446.1 polyphosphate kinase 1 [Photobacterium ganghwense]QSV13553.1 polyphosphate kinase 1 [Photobacterium ganghwense]